MSVLTAIICSGSLGAATAYTLDKISVIPLTGKRCPINWKAYQYRLPYWSEITRWFKSPVEKNIGIVCGSVSGNLVVMDLDGEWGIHLFREQFPNLLDTLTVRTGSGKGLHLYYYAKELPPTTRHNRPGHEAIEMRANGSYVVACPSVHPDTNQPYKATLHLPIKTVESLNPVREWLEGLSRALPQPSAPVRPAPTGRTQRTMRVGDPVRWASAALYKEAQTVRQSNEGQRNGRLNTAAYNLGQIIGDGHLSFSEVEATLLNAARQAGLSESEALKTIHSGLAKGQAEPRSRQWQKRNA